MFETAKYSFFMSIHPFCNYTVSQNVVVQQTAGACPVDIWLLPYVEVDNIGIGDFFLRRSDNFFTSVL